MNPSLKASLLIITSHRDEHLQRQLDAIKKLPATEIPADIIVVFMNQREVPEIPYGLKVKTFHCVHSRLPLAAARNVAASKALYEMLIFLDVDCIPEAGTFLRLCEQAEGLKSVVMAQPLYLQAQSYNISHALVHPVRANLVGISERYEMFWSLAFAISQKNFTRVGGFDEKYVGYGAEDTDFAFTLQEEKIPLTFSLAKVYHQQHTIFKPALNHFLDIIDNSQIFYQKWHVWPMKDQLTHFSHMKLILWDLDSKEISLLREPTAEELQAALREQDPF